MLQKQKHVQAHNNAQEHLRSKPLRQILNVVSETLNAAGEPFRVRARPFSGSEVLKIYALATDHQLHFSVLTDRQNNVHVKSMKYRSVFTDPARAGWSSPQTCDILADANGNLSQGAVGVIVKMTKDWLFLNAANARTPRETFLARDGVSKADSPFVAGTFVIDQVKVSTTPDFSIVVKNEKQGCSLVLDRAFSSHINEPFAMRGCRAIVHESGVIRVLRETSFSQLYQLCA